MRTPDFTGMPNLEELNLEGCRSLEEVHPSLKCCRKLIKLNLKLCEGLVRFPDILGIMKPELEIKMKYSGIRELPSSLFQHQTHLTELKLSSMSHLVALPNSIGILKGLEKLDVSYCSKLESLPKEIGDLENLEKLNASYTLISQPPSSIVRLNKLKDLSFAKDEDSKENFVLPQLNGGLRSLEILDLSGCNLIDGRLPEDIGCLSSLKELNLNGNNFEHLPQTIAQLGALRSLHLRRCKMLEQLPEFPEQLDTINADWRNDRICNSLFQNISSLQHGISASDSLSLRVLIRSRFWNSKPSWFHHWGSGTKGVSVNLAENWYISDNLLGFAVCYYSYGKIIDITAHLILLCDDGMLSMTQKLALTNHSEYDVLYFFLLPLSGLWDASKANGKTPNDYGCLRLSFSRKRKKLMKKFGVRLVYKDEPTEHCIGDKEEQR